jgi:hypothetical protein
MGNPQANLAAAFESSEAQLPTNAEAAEVEQPRDFHFAVTWVTLFAHLDLMESAGPRSRPQPAPILDLVPLAPAPLVETGHRNPPLSESGREPGAAWEMVVPKMIRTGPGQFTPLDDPPSDAPERNS